MIPVFILTMMLAGKTAPGFIPVVLPVHSEAACQMIGNGVAASQHKKDPKAKLLTFTCVQAAAMTGAGDEGGKDGEING